MNENGYSFWFFLAGNKEEEKIENAGKSCIMIEVFWKLLKMTGNGWKLLDRVRNEWFPWDFFWLS